MSDARERRVASLGSVDPAGSRHQGRRSAVALTDRDAIVGTADGTVVAFDRDSLTERWRAPGDETASVVSLDRLDDLVLVGERGPRGTVRAYDETGTERWRYETATDVGTQQQDTRFFRPFVVDVASDGDRWYAAARRYERRPDAEQTRQFESVVYAFERDGTEAWRYRTDASPISLATDGERIAVAYNRCPGTHQRGLVVLDSDGREAWSWDPGTDGQRRVGDVSLLDGDVVLTCHGDYHGYRLSAGGAVEWSAPLATPQTIDDETVYAYPNHVHATERGVVFVTGNTYPEEGREATALHPDEHTAFGYGTDGSRRFRADVEGFASELAADGDRVAVPCAQNFRRRDPDAHGCRCLDVADGHLATVGVDGVATAAAVDDAVAVVEEPVVYHDDGEERGRYRLHVASLSN